MVVSRRTNALRSIKDAYPTPATNEPVATAAVFLTTEATDMVAAYCPMLRPTASWHVTVGPCTLRSDRHGGGGGGGSGPSIGTVIGGRPGISTTVWPISGGGPPGIGITTGGGGGGGGTPLLIWIVMIEPGMVCPLGVVPTTVPYLALLLTELLPSATWKPASLSRCRAAFSSRPLTTGTC